MTAPQASLCVLNSHFSPIKPRPLCAQPCFRTLTGRRFWPPRSSPVYWLHHNASSWWPGRSRCFARAHTAISAQPHTASSRFQLHPITGDGSCMFRAIVQGNNYLTKGTLMSEEAERTASFNLRQAVDVSGHAGITDDWEGYLQRMESEHVWGGEPELVVSVNIIKRPITVYRPVRGVVEPVITYGQELGRTPVSLLWGGAHYELLLPTRPTLGS
ncbi:hypothetical protein V8C86DRAFT_2753537 [Haematococcus lacustris]